ncbi:hypothetical protein PTI98_006878 [Pleurotus ostreatus]|nr:hypothetical protein PTI98_006878 [Pleurotus ostreatus]
MTTPIRSALRYASYIRATAHVPLSLARAVVSSQRSYDTCAPMYTDSILMDVCCTSTNDIRCLYSHATITHTPSLSRSSSTPSVTSWFYISAQSRKNTRVQSGYSRYTNFPPSFVECSIRSM